MPSLTILILTFTFAHPHLPLTFTLHVGKSEKKSVIRNHAFSHPFIHAPLVTLTLLVVSYLPLCDLQVVFLLLLCLSSQVTQASVFIFEKGTRKKAE